MNAGEVVEGVGLCAWGLVVYGLMRWQVRDDGRLRRMAESRWWLVAALSVAVRGLIGQ
jgi:hypothetical protein